jgi:NAD(P)-dependent dehydrogenase (short-subunit alcohol dehydrogenase family)
MPSGRKVIATGGTGALGRAVVRAFLAAGDRVIVPWIVPAERAAIAQAEEPAVRSGSLVLVEADVAEDAGARTTVAAAGGAVDVLVNGVGGFAGGAPVVGTELEVWDRLYRMNVRTVVAMCRAAVPGMLERGRGSVLAIASQAAPARPAGLAAYSASKDAVIVLCDTLQKEVGSSGVRVNLVAPGTIDTPANRAAMPGADTSSWTPPERIARVLLWLASEEAASVRGALIPV